MFDKELVIDSLQKIKAMLELIIERASVVDTPNDFLCSSSGMMRLDAICMNLIDDRGRIPRPNGIRWSSPVFSAHAPAAGFSSRL